MIDASLSYTSTMALLNSRSLVQHSYEVLLTKQTVFTELLTAIVVERGFLITGGEANLDLYEESRTELVKNLSHLRELTNDNPVQKGHLVRLSAIIDDELATLAGAIRSYRENGPAAGQSVVAGGNVTRGLRAANVVLDAITTEEDRLLTMRTATAHRNAVITYATFAVAAAGVLALLIWVYLLLARELRERNANTELLEERVHLRTAQLEAINHELEAFCYSVSHDLRAPLRSVSGFSEALAEDYADRLDDDGRDYLRRIVAASAHMGNLIDDLLSLSRVTRGTMSLDTVDLSAMAESVAAELAALEPARHVAVSIQPGLSAHGDPRLLRIVLTNLLGNAFKYTAREPEPSLRFEAATDPEGNVAFVVRDNGVGFEMAYADKLFTPFQRLHRPEDFAGTGIGLAIVQRIVARHGGRVWAEGEPHRGASFYFAL